MANINEGFTNEPPCFVIDVKDPIESEKQDSTDEDVNKNEFHRDGLDCDSIESLIPDGGYGWIVVFASFMCNFTVDGICYTFGLFLPYFLKEFGASRGVTALAGSLLSGCYMTVGKWQNSIEFRVVLSMQRLAGVFVSGLVNRFGCRPVAITGSLIAAISFLISTQVHNITLLIITYGIISKFNFRWKNFPIKFLNLNSWLQFRSHLSAFNCFRWLLL